MHNIQGFCLKVLAAGVALAIATGASAQAPRSKINAPATPGLPEFRDPKTGQIWTPENVGGVGGPNTPADRAFDPLAQAARVEGIVVQRPQITPLSPVPITAGPTVPIVNTDGATLRVVPGGRWQFRLYLNNNSAKTVLPVLACRFTNGANLVEATHALVPPVAGGMRVGFTIYGPKSDLFVDNADCQVTSP